MARTVNLTVTEAEDWIIAVTLHDGDDQVLDLTDASAIICEVTARYGEPLSVIASLANDMIEVVGAASEGNILITIPAASHSTLLPKVYSYVCRATLASGVVTDQIIGKITVEPSP